MVENEIPVSKIHIQNRDEMISKELFYYMEIS